MPFQYSIDFQLLNYLAGSDYPYASPDKSLGFKQILDGFPLDPELREKIYFGNARNLFEKPQK